jgi:hypothetical protein
MAEQQQTEQQAAPHYLIRVVDHQGNCWYLGERQNAGTDLLHPNEMDEENCPTPIVYERGATNVINAAPVTRILGVRDGHVPWRNFEMYDDYAQALERMTKLMDVGFIVPPALMSPLCDDFPLSKLKFDLLVERCNPIYQVDTGVASASVMTFRTNVFVELCSTRFEINPSRAKLHWDEKYKHHYTVESGEAYIVHALIRYPLTYRRKTNEQPKAVGQDQQVPQLRAAPPA